MELELRPCPFCGRADTPEVTDWNDANGIDEDDPAYEDGPAFVVVCNYRAGGCGAVGGVRDRLSEAVDAWNGRAGE